MTFEELFEKMEMNEKGGVAAIAKDHILQMKKNLIITNNDNYNWLNGFLWGLNGAGFISAAEKEDLMNIVFKLWTKKE